MDLCATDYDGIYSFATCYNSEGAVTLEGMMAADLDHLYVFNIPEIEKAVAAGQTMDLGNGVPVVDARGENSAYVLRVPIPKSPHGVNIDPTGRYAVCSGKLSPTVAVVDSTKLAEAFAGNTNLSHVSPGTIPSDSGGGTIDTLATTAEQCATASCGQAP